MGFNYKFTSKADKDLDDIYEYYEDKQKGLGKRFIQNVFSKIETRRLKSHSKFIISNS
ncbi:MAG: type II toxin-antitoxin system RelE/ParE family toxin [Leptospiraceae bacterium]|nr:type II toxin-antitoxin system RelE/ParE family toxin [Leptospiraceae bacterium]